jgi:hypothetical protein
MDAIKFSQVNSCVNAKLKIQVPKTLSLSIMNPDDGDRAP